MQSDINLGSPRRVVYQSFETSPAACPQCDGCLQQSKQTYSVATRRGRKLLDSFVMGSDFGWYCDSCPVVVIGTLQVRALLAHSMPHWDVGNEFCVEGIVDLDAIPEHKRHLPIGDENNPMPLIEFQQPRVGTPRQSLTKKQRQQRQKLLAKKLSEKYENKRKSASWSAPRSDTPDSRSDWLEFQGRDYGNDRSFDSP